MTTHRLALIGLPATGKSTYLGTLWHMVEEPSVDDVREAQLAQDPRHVQTLAEANRAMQRNARTSHDADDSYVALVEFVGRGTVTLDVHDRSGEQLQTLVERRTWPPLLREEIGAAEGVLLFVSPDTVQAPLSHNVTEAWDALLPDAGLAEAGGTAQQNAGERGELRAIDVGTTPGFDDYNNHAACTAAKLIDGLENILDAMSDRWPVHVAIVISKFDLISGHSPEEWLRERLPAVAALLDSDPRRAKWTVFGVSALGGSHSEAEEVLALGDLHERALAVDAANEPVPFAAPVSWALGWP